MSHWPVPSYLSLAMLFLVFIYYLVQGASESTDASPIPSLDKLSLESNRCTDLTHCRVVYNIIWSCLITIFSCTWVAIHPIFHVRRDERRTVGLKDIYVIHCCRLPSIAFRYSFVRCLYPSTFWLGQSDNS